jgi:hypothetical protein
VRDPATGLNGLSGLSGPKWPEAFGQIDRSRSTKGEVLYGKHCAGCHLLPLNSDQFWRNQDPYHTASSGSKFFEPLTYYNEKPGAGQSEDDKGPDKRYKHSTPDALLKMKIIPLEQIGTDSATADIMQYRTVDTVGDAGGTIAERTAGMGISADICSWEPKSMNPEIAEATDRRLVNVKVEDNPDELFGLALGAIVQQVNEEWFAQKFISKEDQAIYEEHRPNCLQIQHGYKARPHDGIWATAPFLHNGSIATVYDLLSPPEDRPRYVQLGNVEFDPINLGIKQPENTKSLFSQGDKGDKYSRDGYFILDTSVPGNGNYGHEFSTRWKDKNDWSDQEKGVIGPLLSEEERLDLIEFLKTL